MSKNESRKLTPTQRAEWSQRVKALRQAKDLTQEQLADEARVSRASIISLEKGATVPQSDKLVRILMHLGVDVFEARFQEDTEIWLTMMGTLIEAIPKPRRMPVVNDAIQVLARGIEGETLATVSPIRRDVVPATEDVDLHRVRLDPEKLAANTDNSPVSPDRSES